MSRGSFYDNTNEEELIASSQVNSTNAASSATAAAASAASAAASYDSFDDRYLGTKSSDPSTDNDSATLIDGALYFNTTNNVMMVYDLGNTTWNRTTPTTTNQGHINTVSGIAANVTTVAGVSSDVTTVAGISSDVAAVQDIAANVTAVAGDAADIGAVAAKATEIGRLGTSDAVADMNTLGTSAIVTDMDLLATSANVTAMGHLGTAANVTAQGLLGTSAAVADMAILGTSDVVADLNTLGTSAIVSDMDTLADIAGNITTVAGISSNVTSVAGNASNITAVAGNATNINAATTKAAEAAASATAAASSASTATTQASTATTQAGIATAKAVLTAADATATAADVVSSAANAASAAATYDGFDDRYLGSKSSAPSVDNDGNALVVGALYFDSTANVMKVYTASGWIATSSATLATMERFVFTASADQTVFTGSDAGGDTLAIVVGAELVTLNGVVLEVTADYTVTTSRVTLTSGAAVNDELNVYAFGNFEIANHYTKTAADLLYDAKASLSGAAFTGAITTNSTIDGRDVAADGVLATNALPKSGGAMTGAITTNSTFDGRDVAADGVTADAALPKAGGAMTGAITTNSTFDGRDVGTDGTKLDGIEANATADQTAEEIQDIVGAMVASNTETGITVTYEDGDGTLDFVVASQTDENFTTADHSKLDGIAASANNYVHPNHSGEVTSTADGATVIADNVVDEANLKISNSPTNGYVLTAQSGNTGGLTWAADSTTDSTKMPLAGGAFTGAVTTNSTFDGVDIATRDAVLTSTTTTANAALPKAGGAMTGAITTNSTFDGVDIATRDAILTSTTTTAGAALPKAGGTMTGAVVGATDTDASNSGTVDLDFTDNTNFVLTLTGAITSLTASNEVAGQSGFIVFIQDGTGGRTVALHGDYETAAGAGLTLTSTASATDIVPYVVAASSRILLGTPQLAFA